MADGILTEHFGWTPLALLDDIIDTINAVIHRALNAVEAGLLDAPPRSLGFQSADTDRTSRCSSDGVINASQQNEVNDGLQALETLMTSAVDTTFDKLEIYALRNLLRIPDDLVDWIRLPHYHGLQLGLHPRTTPQHILHLRQRLVQARQLNLNLLHTHSQYRKLVADLHARLSELVPTNPGYQQAENLDLERSAEFVAIQSRHLRSFLTDLRPKLRLLRERALYGAHSDRAADQRATRSAYLESTASRVVAHQLKTTIGDDRLGKSTNVEDVQEIEWLARRVVDPTVNHD